MFWTFEFTICSLWRVFRKTLNELVKCYCDFLLCSTGGHTQGGVVVRVYAVGLFKPHNNKADVVRAPSIKRSVHQLVTGLLGGSRGDCNRLDALRTHYSP